jgi:ABC-2 type transport system ATP-binding protein
VTPVIEVTDLVRRFGSFTAVDNVSFHVEPGEIFGYLGANGAGKSTTIRMLTGLLSPTSGDAVVAGNRLSRSPEDIKRVIGYMSQKFSLYLDLTVQENLEFYGGAQGLGGRDFSRRLTQVTSRAGVTDILHHRTGDLPGGLRQRVALASALLHSPRVVFLDEPTAGVDPSSRRDFWSLIRELASEGVTVFVTTHYMDEAEYCARVGLMVDGRLVALDTPAGLAATHVPGRLVVVKGKHLLDVADTLRAAPGVLAVDPFGAGLHVRVAADLPDATLATRIQAAGGADLSLTTGRANLEHVFLVLAGRATRGDDA